MLNLTTRAGGEVTVVNYTSLPDLVHAVEELGSRDGWSDDLTFRIGLVVDELVQNVVDYGYSQDPLDAEIVVTCDPDLVTIEITDHGRPFDPLTQAPAPDLTSPLEDRPIGGLGVHFTKTLMDDVSYSRIDGENRLKVVTRKA